MASDTGDGFRFTGVFASTLMAGRVSRTRVRVELDTTIRGDEALRQEFQQLWSAADRIWQQHLEHPAFSGYVSADYPSVFQALTQLQGRIHSVLEWGSGLGVVAIMASRMGFEAYGIEAEAALLDHAEGLAADFRATAKFVHGSFIPDDYQWDPSHDDGYHGTEIDVRSAYDEMGIEIRDFDLIYAYPWPGEHDMYHDIMWRYAGPNQLFLSYDAFEGLQLNRFRCRSR